VLAAHGTDSHEFALLYCTWMEQAPPDEFVIYVRNLDNLDREQFTVADHAKVPEYAAALNRLIARGWIVILGESDIENERARVVCVRRCRSSSAAARWTQGGSITARWDMP